VQRTSQASGYRFKYGIAAAGAVGSSIIGHLSRETLGPVYGVSYRVASRIANTLGGGYPVRSATELNSAPAILFHAPPDQSESLLELLELAPVEWSGKPLIFCDCVVDEASIERFNVLGASVAVARKFEIPGYLILEGTPLALITGHRIAKELRMKPIEISAGCAGVFDAAVTLGTCALTPLIDSAVTFLRDAGVRDTDAPRLAAALFQETARSYAHSGKQSWGWYVKEPEVKQIEAQIQGAGPQLGPVLRQLLLYGFELFDKHAAIADSLKTEARPDKAGLR
jgi:hypothetical protein